MTNKFTVEQKYEILMESLNSDESIAEIRRKHGAAPVNFRKWRERFLEGGMWHRRGMTGSITHCSAQVCGTTCLISADHRIVSHTLTHYNQPFLFC